MDTSDEAKVLVEMAIDLQSYQGAKFIGIQATGAGDAFGRKIHSGAGTMLGGRSTWDHKS